MGVEAVRSCTTGRNALAVGRRILMYVVLALIPGSSSDRCYTLPGEHDPGFLRCRNSRLEIIHESCWIFTGCLQVLP